MALSIQVNPVFCDGYHLITVKKLTAVLHAYLLILSSQLCRASYGTLEMMDHKPR